MTPDQSTPNAVYSPLDSVDSESIADEYEIGRHSPTHDFDKVEQEAVEEAAKLDGKAMFETTRTAEELSAAAVARAYRDRDTVEKFTESIKDTANLRPHYVYTEQHVRARVFVCVLSVLLIATLQLAGDVATTATGAPGRRDREPSR